MRVLIHKEIWRRLAEHDGYSKALADFVECVEHGRHPPRTYKRSGIARDGSRFEPYLRLNLWHHHLHRSGDPLLVVQCSADSIVSVALANHREHLSGDKMLWLRTHADAIDWSDCQDLYEQVMTSPPSAAR